MGDTEAQKRAKNKWKRENMQFFGAKLRNDEAERYRAACKRLGTTPNGYLLAAARALIAEEEAASGASSEKNGGTSDTSVLPAPVASGGAE